MKFWKSILQNVLSGCVGALLVIGVAQAQKTVPTLPSPEIRTQKLVIVDDDGKEMGYLGVHRGGPVLSLRSGDYGVQLSAMKDSGASVLIGSEYNRYINLAVNDKDSELRARNGKSSSATLRTSDGHASMLLTLDGFSTDSKHFVMTAVDENDTDIELVGPKSGVSIGHAPQQSLGGLFCRMNNPKGGALTLSNNKNRVYWSKFPPEATNK